jgi:hypothetical protein
MKGLPAPPVSTASRQQCKASMEQAMRPQFGRQRRNRFDLLWSDLVALLAIAASVAIVFRQVLGM